MENAVKDFLRDRTPEMFKLLRTLVLTQSGSANKAGCDRVGRMVAQSLSENRLTCETIGQDRYGDHLLLRTDTCRTHPKQILLMGHVDTVFPIHTDFNTYREDDVNCYGPGVFDMKGGLVAGIFALKAIDAIGALARLPVCFMMNTDEEVGSVSSRNIVAKEARRSLFALVLEGGGPNGEIVTGRKGNLTFSLQITGCAGHAAFVGRQKASAILALAHQILAYESLNDHDRGVTANVGKITGGIGANTVAERAAATIDMRFSKAGDLDRLRDVIETIARHTGVPGTRATVNVRSSRSPMTPGPGTDRLAAAVQRAAGRLGLRTDAEFRPGCSDANFIAAEHTPVIDGLGPLGGNDHSADEFMVKASLVQRSALIALSMIDAWQAFSAEAGQGFF